MVGEVTFYFRNGRVEHTEFYNDPSQTESPDSTLLYTGDCPKKVGTWMYYDKHGRKTKTILHQLEKKSDSDTYCWVSITTLFDINGNAITSKKVYDKCY